MMFWFLVACSSASPDGLGRYGAMPAFTLVDQTGRVRTREDFGGKVVVVDFIFTSCPDVCPTLTAQMAEVARRYTGNPDVRFLSFSVDPATDTPAVLATFAEKFDVDAAQWSFVTGPLDDVRTAVTGGFKQVMEETGGTEEPRSVIHGTRFVVVDRHGQMRAFVSPAEPGHVATFQAIDALLAER